MNANQDSDVPIRRSTRQRVETDRGRSFNIYCHDHRPAFPLVSEDILVKWILDGQVVWWRATVLRVDGGSPSTTSDRQNDVCGEILYHKHGTYPPEHALVKFHRPNEEGARFLSTQSKRRSFAEASPQSSWIYYDEPIPESESESAAATGQHRAAVRTKKVPAPRTSRAAVEIVSTPQGADDVQVYGLHAASRLIQKNRRGHLRTKPSPSVPTTNVHESDSNTALPNPSNSTDLIQSASPPFQQISVPQSATYNGTQNDPSVNPWNNLLEARLQFVERQLQLAPEGTVSAKPVLTSSTISLLLGLKWAFLKRLERPLKKPSSDYQRFKGLVQSTLSVKCDCDSRAFRDIATVVAKKLQSVNEDGSVSSRVAFYPSLNQIQCGSLGTQRLAIAFSSLSDLTDMLGIRDEYDYEKLLIKEVITENVTLMQLIGTVSKQTIQRTNSEAESGNSSSSVIATSHPQEKMCIAIGCSTVSPLSNMHAGNSTESGNDSESTSKSIETMMFEQCCLHYSPEEQCYRTKWSAAPKALSVDIPRTIDILDESRNFNYNNYYFLEWNKMKTPSASKWSSDVQYHCPHSPGHLQLSVPTIFISSRRNVTSISKLLDAHLESFMNMRLKLQNKTAPLKTANKNQ